MLEETLWHHDGFLKDDMIVVTKSKIADIVTLYHDHLIEGHSGVHDKFMTRSTTMYLTMFATVATVKR